MSVAHDLIEKSGLKAPNEWDLLLTELVKSDGVSIEDASAQLAEAFVRYKKTAVTTNTVQERVLIAIIQGATTPPDNMLFQQEGSAV